MANSHPQNAAYVSADGLVSFDRYGRKLDSNGNLAHSRQRAGDAGASPIQRREPEQPKGPPAQPAVGYTFPANATGQPVQRSAWDNSPVAPAQGAASAAGVSGPSAYDVPNRGAAQFGTWPQADRWESRGTPYTPWRAGNTWQGTPASNAPMPQQIQSYVPPSGMDSVPAPAPLGLQNLLPADAFQRAAQNWGAQGLPMPNNAQFDPYPEQQFSVYPLRRTYNGAGLPVPNNQAFDPYW